MLLSLSAGSGSEIQVLLSSRLKVDMLNKAKSKFPGKFNRLAYPIMYSVNFMGEITLFKERNKTLLFLSPSL